MIDTFSYKSPFGILGKAANHLFLEKYMSHFIARHAQKVKRIAEATKYKLILILGIDSVNTTQFNTYAIFLYFYYYYFNI